MYENRLKIINMKTTVAAILTQYFEGNPTIVKNTGKNPVMKDRINGNRVDLKVKVITHYPSPFKQKASLVYKLEQPSLVSLVVYNPEFRGMCYLASGYKDKGYHRVDFDASCLPAGVYVARLRTEQGIVKEYMTKLNGPDPTA
jgi:hypothetical protein